MVSDQAYDDDLDGEDGEDGDEGPWPIINPPPATIDGWMVELLAGFRRHRDPPQLETEDGEPFIAGTDGMLEVGVALCLFNRGARIPVEAVYGLISVIGDMVAEMAGMGPEWERLSEVPPLTFTIYYLWSHIVIGHLSEDFAMEVVNAATVRLEQFDQEGGES
jgi:hypothetical protein